MWSRVVFSLALFTAACVTPRMPTPAQPPAPDRYARAADPDPAARARAADELAHDPHPQAADLLLTLHGRDVDPAVRARAADAIQRRRDPSLDGALARSAVQDPDPGVRAASAAAYDKLYPWRKRPGTAAGLSLLCPGCGQLYLGKSEGWAYLGVTAALIAGGIVGISSETVSLDGPARSAKVPIGLALVTAGQNLWFYSMFDAYRDARVARGDLGYRIPISRESLGELASAPFRPDVLASPWVWGGVPAMLAGGLLVSYLVDRGGSSPRTIFDVDKVNVLGHDFGRGSGYAAGLGYYAALFTPVGVGEEALFRGIFQTELAERFGDWPGLALASMIFGGFHITNFLDDPKTAAVAIPTISVLGATLGLAYKQRGYKLEVPVAMHFWYDFLLSAVSFAVDPENQPFVVQYGGRLF